MEINRDVDAIFEAASKLSDSERLILLMRLLDTVPMEATETPPDDEAWERELERRFVDTSETVSWAEIQAEN